MSPPRRRAPGGTRVVGAGYSGKPLGGKLGLKPGLTIAILHAPPGYARTLGPLPGPVRRRARAAGPLDFIQCFARDRTTLARQFGALAGALAPAGVLWISWPKRASGVATDLTEDVIRALGLAHGLVDVKVVAVDEVWSGLKFVRRLRDR